MKIISKIFSLKTKTELEFIDITQKIKSFVKKNNLKNGIINIFCLHTTASIIINENEPLLKEDFINYLKKLAPKNLFYNHNDFARRTVNVCDGECKNGHSHCVALYLPTNITLNVVKGIVQLGTWQRVFLIELDHARERKIQLQVLGE